MKLRTSRLRIQRIVLPVKYDDIIHLCILSLFRAVFLNTFSGRKEREGERKKKEETKEWGSNKNQKKSYRNRNLTCLYVCIHTYNKSVQK